MYDLHIHSIFSDGELIPAEIARRYFVLGYRAIAITDHADNSNLEFILSNTVDALEELSAAGGLEVIPGIELTHMPLGMLNGLVRKARELGARIIVVHGETLAEPVQKGTNLEAVKNPEVDILAHPGLITVKEAELAKKNGIYLELTSRAGHCITNGHVAKVAEETGASLILNTDAHAPGDIITKDDALAIARGAGLSQKNSEMVVSVNPESIVGI
ncbi:MAG: histidinol phosphate phosphatase domain-containing protein [Candidatus Hydrothermarchaeaceae archaeon]